MNENMTGGCQCGRVRYVARIDNDEAYLCHCRMCQRATGGVFAALKNLSREDVDWVTIEPDRYASSPIARRGFCGACGTPLTYEGNGRDKLDLTIGSFDDPSRFRPVGHSGVESRHESWTHTSDLPSARTDENPGIVQQWMEATGHGPD